MDFDREHDARVRAAAFDWLAGQASIYGETFFLVICSERVSGLMECAFLWLVYRELSSRP